MKKSWQRLGSAFLAFLMVFTMLPASVLADSGTAAGDSLNVSGTPAVRSVINPGTDSSSYQTYRFYVEGTLVDTQVVKTGDTLYAPATPAKEGHKFLGWSQSQSGGSYFTAFGAQTVTADGEVNLYADFAKVYYVFFMDTRGRVYATKEGTTGDSIAADVTFPVNADQAITGWYTEAGLTNRVESVTLGEANITLYPKVENGHWITYDSKGGSYVEPAFVAPSGVTVAPAAPSRPGYTFGGWTRNGSAFTFGGALSENIQLEASWRAGTNTAYTVIHWWENADNDQYAFHESENRTGASGAQTAASAKSYTGFTAQTITQQTIEGDGSTIVNVYYDRNEYSVKFYQYQSSGWSGSWNELTGLRITAKYGANISDQWPSSTSMIWGTTKGNRTGDSPYQSGIDTMPLNGDEFYYVNQSGKYTMSLKYYTEVLDGATGSDIVTYQGKRYRLDHTDSFKSDNTRWSTTAEDHYPITGFTYTNNLPDGSSFTNNGSNNYSVTFYYNRNDYSINFSNGGNVTHSEAKQYQADISGVSYTPTRPSGVPESYVFQGWYDNEMFAGDPYVFTGTMPANNIIVYAKWAAPTFTGTIHVTMAGSGATNIIEIPYGSTIDESTLEHEEVPAGSEWVGWALRTGSEGHYTYTPFNFDTRIYGDITLYPYYISTTAFTVSYDANSGSGAPADSKRYAQDSYAEIMASSGMTAPANKIFLSWNTESDGSGDTYYPKDKLHIGTENITLYAQWGDAPVPVSVSYHANYPDSTTADPYVVSGLRNNDQHTVLSLEGCGFAKAQADYEFLGWSTSESGTEAEYAVGAQIRLDNNGENHLYAIWKAKPVLVITANSGSRPYDGTALTADGYKLTVNGGAAIEVGADGVHTFENGDVLSVVITGSQTDAGESANAVTSYTIQRGAAAVTGKYKVTAVNGKLEVTPKAVTIKAADDDFTYDGSAHSNANYTVTGLVGSDAVTATVAGSITYPSQSPVKNEVTGHTFTAGRADNYTVSYADGQLTMTYGAAQAITVTADSKSWTYDGNAHAQDSYTVKIGDGKPQPVGAAGVYTFANGDVLTVVVEGSVTNVAEGEVTNAITSLTITNQGEDVSGAYSITRNNGTLKINPKAVRVIAASEAFKYDGKAHSNAGYTAEGLVGSDAISAVVEGSITYPSQSPVDNVLKSYEFTSGTAGNYSVTTENGTLTMSYADAVEITVTAGSKSWTYDGNAHSQDSYTLKIGNGAPIPVGADGIYTFENGDVLTVEITGSVTNVAEGTVANTISSLTITNGTVDVSGAYAVTRSNGTLKINPKTVTIKAADDDFTYDGSAHSNANYTVTGLVGSDAVTATVAGSITYPSQSPVKNEVTGHTFTAGSADNYTVSYTDGQLTMTYGAAQAITVTADNKSWTYDGNAHSQDSYTLKIGNDAPISVGADGVYTFANGDVLTVEITGSVTNVAEGTVANTVASLTITNGAEDVSAAYAVTRNNGTLKIAPKAVTITAKSKEFEYDGQPHSYSSYSVNGLVDDDEISATVTGSITYPSESPVANQVTAHTFVKGAASNYAVEYVDGTLTMVPSTTEVTVTITGNHDSRVYNTSEQSVTGFTTDVGEKTISVVLADGSEAVAKGTDVGSYKMGLTEDNFVVTSDNYSNIKVVVVDGYLDITPTSDEVTVTITGHTDTRTYNGREYTVTGYDVSSSNPFYTEADFRFNGTASVSGTDADSYPMGLTEDDFSNTNRNFSNVVFDVTDGGLTIDPKAVTITAASEEFEYNGQPRSNAGYTVEGLVGSDAISAVVEGSITYPSQSPVKNTVVSHEFTTGNPNNYEVSYAVGELTMTAASGEIVVTITGKNDTAKYDGEEHTVTGYDVTISSVLYTENDFTFNGTASASRIDAGTTDMGLTAEDFVNHNDSFSNVVFVVEDGFVTVEKRVLTLTSASDEKLYDSYPLRNDKVTVSGDGFAEGEGAVYDVTGVQRGPGDSKNTFDYLLNDGTKAENYEITKVEGTLKITAPDSLYYSIEYYYNGIINPSMTRTVSGVKLGDVIENVDAASITEGELSGNYKFIEAVGLPLTIGVETSENVLRLYYESGEIAHDPDAAIQIIHQYYTDGRFSGEQKRSLDSAEAGQQIYIDNRNMPANQVIRSAPIYGRRGYDFDGSRIRVERTPFSYEVIFHGNGFVADPASISVNYKSNFTIPADGTANLIWMTEKGKKLVAEVIEAIETTGIDSGSDSADFLAYLMAQRYPNEHGKEYFFPGQEYPLATAANLDLYAYVLKRTTLTNADISEAFAQAESDLIALKRAVARGVDPEDTGFVGTLRSLFGMKKVDPDLKARYQACYEALSDEIYELGDLLDRFEEENDKKLSEKTWERYGNLLAGLNELEEMIENLDVIIDSGYQDSGYQDSGYLDSGFTVTRTSSGSDVSVQKKSVSFLEGLFGGMQVAQVIDYGTSATYPMTITKLDSFLYEEGYTYTVTLTYNRTTGGGGGGDNDDPTPIPDNPVPLGPSPDLVTILDEEVPLGKLPTSGSNRNAHRAGGAALMAVILGLLAKGRRRDGEGGSGEGTDSSGE
ncbi:MAG: InlB B-repeat-containing protein [Oscillospiraceae bacterium]|nr:InlB B-repeat-containing protein [Oscillospiraceae bacterium]